MAKKKQIIEEKNKAVTNRDQLLEPVANCDQIVVNEPTFSQSDIEKMIVTIRGVQVMIDRDLARVYSVTTSQLNQQVKRNIARFPNNFRFQLTEAERDEVVTNCDNLRSLKFNPTLPYAFTEPGIAQLSSVLHSKKAIETSVKIMSAFVAMRHFLIQNASVLMRIAHLERHQIETDEKIDLILDKMEERSPKLLPEQIFQTGCVWDAWSYISDLVRSAKYRIVLIDNFVDDRVLSLLMKRGEGVTATIHSRFTKDFLTDLEKHNKQYAEVQSPIAVRFHRRATQWLHEYIQKDFTIDDERLKQGGNKYFRELLQRIRDIRSSERNILSTSDGHLCHLYGL